MPVVLFGGVSAEPVPVLDAESATKFFDLALAGIDREYPNKPGHVFQSDRDVRPPRQLHPVFYGHFDWHSSVHGHWTLVRLMKLFPQARADRDGPESSRGPVHGGGIAKRGRLSAREQEL